MREQLATLVNDTMAEDFAEIPGVTRAALLRLAHAAARIGAELERLGGTEYERGRLVGIDQGRWAEREECAQIALDAELSVQHCAGTETARAIERAIRARGDASSTNRGGK
jgi:hypothetical protein